MDLIARVKHYLELTERRRELEDRLAAVKAEAAEVERDVLDGFAADGIDRMTVDGRTVYLHSQIWASRPEGVETEDVVAALHSAGLGHMVNERYSSQTISAYLRDLEREGEELPPALVGRLEPTVKFSARVRRAG